MCFQWKNKPTFDLLQCFGKTDINNACLFSSLSCRCAPRLQQADLILWRKTLDCGWKIFLFVLAFMIITPVQVCLACFLSYTLKPAGKETKIPHMSFICKRCIHSRFKQRGMHLNKGTGNIDQCSGIGLPATKTCIPSLSSHFFHPWCSQHCLYGQHSCAWKATLSD